MRKLHCKLILFRTLNAEQVTVLVLFTFERRLIPRVLHLFDDQVAIAFASDPRVLGAVEETFKAGELERSIRDFRDFKDS